jgi:hypothetical protein
MSCTELFPNRVKNASKSSFKTVCKVVFNCRNFSRNLRLLNKFIWASPFTEFLSNQSKNVENTGERSFTPIRRVCLSVHRFSQNSQCLTLCVETFYTEFYQDPPGNMERTSRNSLRPSIKYECQSIFAKIAVLFDSFCKEFLYLYENVTGHLVPDTNSRTDGRTDVFSTQEVIFHFFKNV